MNTQPEDNTKPETLRLAEWFETSPNTRDKKAAAELKNMARCTLQQQSAQGGRNENPRQDNCFLHQTAHSARTCKSLQDTTQFDLQRGRAATDEGPYQAN